MSRSQPVILYVPGLGDHYDRFRAQCLKSWKLYGVTVRLVPMQWYDGASFESKLARLTAEIAKHPRVILIGESAGASMVLQVAARDNPNVVRYVTLCGATSKTMPIAKSIQRRGPAFLTANRTLPDTYQVLAKIRCYRAFNDPVVYKQYSSVAGAPTTTIASVGHFFTIVLCLTLYAPWFVRSVCRR